MGQCTGCGVGLGTAAGAGRTTDRTPVGPGADAGAGRAGRRFL